MGGCYKERMRCEGSGKNILKIYKVAVHMCGFDGIGRGNYFEGDSIGRAEVEVKLKNGKAAG